MLKRWGTLLIVVAMGLGVAAPATTTVEAATTDPLVSDSLKALDALVSSDHCTAKDAADNETTKDVKLGYQICDDGVVPSGGGSNGIPVPAAYQPTDSGDDYTGLPAPADDAAMAAADAKYDLQPESGNRITLDVDISLPPAGTRRPKGGFPVIVFMHGCCGQNRNKWESPTVDGANELWHDSNSFFASQGYVVINYTARGFRNSNDQGSTGTTQLDSRRFEMNDYQYLVGLLADDDVDKKTLGEKPLFGINRRKVAAVGGSYGGGFSWMAVTDPTWTSPEHHLALKLGAVVPKYGWTDLVESLVPSGHYLDQDPRHIGSTVVAPSSVDKAPSVKPIGVEKQSVVTALYGTGSNKSGDHTTFPDYMDSTYQRLQQGEPYDGDPTVEDTLKQFLEDRSAYFQQSFWNRVAKGLRIPIFAAGTFTDPLFPTMETVRFYNKLESIDDNYPIKMYLGDYQHLYAQNKPKEWDSLCGDDHHICTIDDYTHDDGSIHLFGKAKGQVRSGALARIDSFLNYYLKGKGRKPANDVSATTTICASNATEKYPLAEPGVEYRAKSWRLLATRVVPFGWTDGTVTNATPDSNAPMSDPVVRNQSPDKCFTTSNHQQEAGVLTATSEPTKQAFTFMGIPWLQLDYSTTDTDYWIAARVYDQKPDGTMTMVTRGVCRVNTDAAEHTDCKTFDLWGGAWTFPKGDQLTIELSQSDTPTFRKDNNASMMTVKSIGLGLPATSNAKKVDFRS